MNDLEKALSLVSRAYVESSERLDSERDILNAIDGELKSLTKKPANPAAQKYLEDTRELRVKSLLEATAKKTRMSDVHAFMLSVCYNEKNFF